MWRRCQQHCQFTVELLWVVGTRRVASRDVIAPAGVTSSLSPSADVRYSSVSSTQPSSAATRLWNVGVVCDGTWRHWCSSRVRRCSSCTQVFCTYIILLRTSAPHWSDILWRCQTSRFWQYVATLPFEVPMLTLASLYQAIHWNYRRRDGHNVFEPSRPDSCISTKPHCRCTIVLYHVHKK